VDRAQLIEFVRQRGLAVVATRGPDGAPQAALVGIATTDRGELVFDTAVNSRKLRNLRAFPRGAVLIGWDAGGTLQGGGEADVLRGQERERCLHAYIEHQQGSDPRYATSGPATDRNMADEQIGREPRAETRLRARPGEPAWLRDPRGSEGVVSRTARCWLLSLPRRRGSTERSAIRPHGQRGHSQSTCCLV